jgi:hypothetical protein
MVFKAVTVFGEAVAVRPVRVKFNGGSVVGDVEVNLVVAPWPVVSEDHGAQAHLEQRGDLKLET